MRKGPKKGQDADSGRSGRALAEIRNEMGRLSTALAKQSLKRDGPRKAGHMIAMENSIFNSKMRRIEELTDRLREADKGAGERSKPEKREISMPGSGWAPSAAEAVLVIRPYGRTEGRLSQGQVQYRGVEIRLTPTQFRIVLELARCPGRIVAHETLHKRASEFPEAQGMDVSRWAKSHLRDLRAAFSAGAPPESSGQKADSRPFATERKGYRLTVERSQIFRASSRRS